jgi:prolipoprotein diacylglyceryltransferase
MNPPVACHYWVNRLDPCAVHVSCNVGIRWYGVACLAGILIAALVPGKGRSMVVSKLPAQSAASG